MKDPIPVRQAFDDTRSSLLLNTAASALVSETAYNHVMNHVGKVMGISKLAPMTSCSVDSMMSMVFYAGDGVVLKVDSSNFLPQAGPFEVPPMTSERIKGFAPLIDQYYDLTVSTYPFLSQRVTSEQIEEFEREQLLPIGLKISPDDKHPRNFRAAPDAKGTLISIDTGSFTPAYNGNVMPDDLKAEFFAYMRLMFPAYDNNEVTQQEPDTSFDPRSPFDPRHDVAGFDVRRCLEAGESAIELANVHNITVAEKPIRPLWRRLLLPFGDGNTVDAEPLDGSEPA